MMLSGWSGDTLASPPSVLGMGIILEHTPPYGLVLRAVDRRPYILVNVSDPALPNRQKLAPEFDLLCGSAQGHSQWGARTEVFDWFVDENSRNCARHCNS